MAASMREVSFPGLGARLPSAAVNSVILEAYVIPGYEKPTDQEEAILDFVKRRDVFVFLSTGAGKSLCFATLLSPCCLSPAWKSTFDTRTGYYIQFLQFEARSYTWQRREPKGYSLFACKKRICHAAGTHSTAWHFHLARTNFTPRCSHQCYVIRTGFQAQESRP